MFLNGIKFQLAEGKKTLTYRFRYNDSRFRNVVFHEGQTDYIVPAIIYGVTGKAHPEILGVKIYLSDQSGDQWQVERRGDRSKVWLNRQVVEDGEVLLAETLTDKNTDQPIIDIFQFLYDMGELRSSRIGQSNPFMDYIKQKGQCHLDRLSESCRHFLGTDRKIGTSSLVSFASQARDIYSEWRENERQLKLLMEQNHQFRDINVSYIDSLEEQVQMLRKIELEAMFLNDPAQSHEILKEKLEHVESALNKICAKNDLDRLPLLSQEIDWVKVIQVLGKIQAYERLAISYKKSNGRVEEVIKPIFENHFRLIKGFLADDRALLGSIEEALAVLTDHYQAAQSQSSDQLNKKTVLQRLFQQQESDFTQSEKNSEVLDSSRSAVDTILRSLGAMCTGLEDFSSSYSLHFDEIQDQYEKIIQELGVQKKQWKILSDKYNIDPKSSLKSILNLINSLSRLSHLYQERHRLQECLVNYKAKLRSLENLLKEWRCLTGSQKSDDLSQAKILISEVRSLISFKKKKEHQLHKLKKVRSKIDFYNGLRRKYQDTIRACHERWHENFSLIGLDTIPLDVKDWNQFFELVHICNTYRTLISEREQSVSGEKAFSSHNLNLPLNIITAHDLGTRGRLEFIKQLQSLSSYANLLIVSNDPELCTELSGIEIGCSELLASAKASTEQPSVEASSQESQDALLSEKARSALELFKGRQASSSL